MTRVLFYFTLLSFACLAAGNSCLSQLKAGDISPTAVKFDLDPNDAMEPFSEGFAVISKGNATAIISREGKYLVDFNKYAFTGQFINGYCMVSHGTNQTATFIDTTGTELKLGPHYIIGDIDKEGFLDMDDGSATPKYFYNVRTKKKYPFLKGYSYQQKGFKDRYFNSYTYDFTPSLIRIQDAKSRKFGYADKYGKIIIQPKYEDAHPFCDGFAVVSNVNEFGQIKYYYINPEGKIMFGKAFSRTPHDFVSGLAHVEPEDKTEFTFGFLDRSGALRIKLKGGGSNQDFYNGYLLGDRRNNNTFYLIDTLGNEITIPQNASFAGVEYKFEIDYPVENGEMMIEGHSAQPGTKKGIINIKGEIVVPPVFESLSFFDPVSRLAKATFKRPDGKITDGYINRKGIFIIIKERSTKW